MKSQTLHSFWAVLLLLTVLVAAHTVWSRYTDRAAAAHVQQILEDDHFSAGTRASILRTLQPSPPDYLNLTLLVLSASVGIVGLRRLREQHADLRLIRSLQIVIAILCLPVFFLHLDQSHARVLLHCAEFVLASALVLSYVLPFRNRSHV